MVAVSNQFSLPSTKNSRPIRIIPIVTVIVSNTGIIAFIPMVLRRVQIYFSLLSLV